MFTFLVKGLLRDKTRFLIPIMVVTFGASLTVTMTGYIGGWVTGLIEQNACIDTGYVKVVTRAYADMGKQRPNEFAILNSDQVLGELKREYPEWSWRKRFYFGGILDTGLGDSQGSQGPIAGMAFDFQGGCEEEGLNLGKGMVGVLPSDRREALIGKELSEKLDLGVGKKFLFLGSTIYGGLSLEEFQVSGVVPFGIKAFDRGTILVTLEAAESLLDVGDAAGEILGFSPHGYRREEVARMTREFNARQQSDRFSPIMLGLEDQNYLREQVSYYESITSIFITVFVVAMGLVLWNTGLIGGIRRYREFGIRLALGESKVDLYGFLILEAVFIGGIGSCLGTLIGLGVTYYLKTVGIDLSSFFQDSSALIPTVIRAEISIQQLYIGFIPGLLSMVMGNMLAGVEIFRRQTALLFKEMEV